MCGIVGMVGREYSLKALLEGLKKLEYRGYDSAGVAFVENGVLALRKVRGRIDQLIEKMGSELNKKVRAGIAHTRWATHGEPNEINAHPQTDCTGKLAVVHNGIIENYRELREELIARGHVFISETDTEVISHLIEENFDGDLMEAVRKTVRRLDGAYAIAVTHADKTEELVVARKGSPLVLGKGDGLALLASDVTPMLSYTRDVVFLSDGDVAKITGESLEICDLDGNTVERELIHVDWDESDAEKSGYKHFMLKEIMEEPEALRRAITNRITPDGRIMFEELEMLEKLLPSIRKVMVVACGTSYHAGLVFKYFLERISELDVEVDVASEFRYRNLHVDENTLVIAISQSGETADTLQGVRLVKRKGGIVVSVCNVVGSTLTRESDATILMMAGPEIGVAATKTYVSQLVVLYLLAMFIASKRQDWKREFDEILYQLAHTPEVFEGLLSKSEEIRNLADKYRNFDHFMYIGRGFGVPTAMEGALKLKEISYINATAYQAGELKHGPIALLDSKFPVFAIAPRDRLFQKMKSNIMESLARGAPIISLGTEGDEELREISSDVLWVPKVDENLYPLVMAPVIQLFAYHVSDLKGLDPDKPRNLAKSVTVE
ncbi:MAG: hypothetical protein PWP37_411 [Thermotogota bacterium]|nr:hypothetical protein [Thermotogota bacterium]MDK2864219.1 hypothetical protein [Thermotogota bacterium]HCZ05650.1 glutamine--fructose-6-phosphate transaminase (isomerizing) [Thermotogota bacterium]